MIHCDEDVRIYNGHFELEIQIARPVSQVWKKFLDMPSWVTTHRIEAACGVPDTVGAVTRVHSPDAQEYGLPTPHYHYCKLVKLVPEKQYVLKTYTEKGGSYGMQMTGFDDTRFFGDETGTRVVFNIFIEIRSDSIAEDPTAMNLDSSREGMARNLLNLKRLVEDS